MATRFRTVLQLRASETSDAHRPDIPSLATLLRISRETTMPAYRQIEEQVAGLVQRGRPAPGFTLPAERQLAEAMGLSRGTV